MNAKIEANSDGMWLILGKSKFGGTPEEFAAAIKLKFMLGSSTRKRAIAKAIKDAGAAGGILAAAALAATECAYMQSAAPSRGDWGGYVKLGAQIFVAGNAPTAWDRRQISFLGSFGYTSSVHMGSTDRSLGVRLELDAKKFAANRTAVRTAVLQSKMSDLLVFCDAFEEAKGAPPKKDDFIFFATATAFAAAAA